MKNKTTLLLVCLLVTLAQGDLINWAGNWDITLQESDQACYPANTVSITQAVGSVTASWVWANSASCTQVRLANTRFTQTVATPSNNRIGLKIRVGGAEIDGVFIVNGDSAIFISNNGASSSYSRRQEMVNWYGSWDVVTQDDNLCNPDGSILLSKYDSSRVRAQWTWAKSRPCAYVGLAGVSFNQVIPISGNAAAIDIQVGGTVVQGIFAIIHDQAVFANANGAAGTFVRRQQHVDWVGTWDINQNSKSSSACYPDGYISIIYDEGDLIASWIWERSLPCMQAGLGGRSFIQSQPIPKGNALFLDILVGSLHVSGLFTSSGENSCTFASLNGAPATFSRRNQKGESFFF